MIIIDEEAVEKKAEEIADKTNGIDRQSFIEGFIEGYKKVYEEVQSGEITIAGMTLEEIMKIKIELVKSKKQIKAIDDIKKYLIFDIPQELINEATNKIYGML